uniref:GDSL esterase/lipase At1g71250-like n=1 Tax=Erigeron canadensis TaxID=72917 RepID=UPI001CB8BDAC|nr:GDSL esterase/lipase At1g71250-like [Erigeron canadensis]
MPIKRIDVKRKRYQEAKEFMNIICNHIDKLGPFNYDHPCYHQPCLEAIRQDAYEVVDEILSRSPGLLRGREYSFIKLAASNRADKIYNLIYHLNVRMDEYRRYEDNDENNILHMVGKLAPQHILSHTTGAALQLQRELQWFQEVEKLMLPKDLVSYNANMETPQMVFSNQHAALVKEGEQWMKTTSESCSITAALIVTIVFAAAITVPGGNVQETGIPLFRKEIAFIIFAVCDAISLFSAASALLVFLSILTTRFAEMDFLVSLPRRLIIGLCALFLSTASMMVAFSAILFLVFCDQRPWMLAPIGGLTCMPIAVIVTLQLPLLVDLFKSTYIPIFVTYSDDPQVPCYFIFGDSLVDCGNNNPLDSGWKANYPPYGIDFTKGPTGRFCNGRTTADLIGEYLGFDEFIPPYATATDKQISKGVNYASGGCGIRKETGSHNGGRLSLDIQLNNHNSTISRIATIYKNTTFLKECIYLVNIGSNDYINNYFMPEHYKSRHVYTEDQFAKVLMKEYSQQLMSLYKLGGRKVALFGLTQMGCTPYMVNKFGTNGKQCVESVNDAVNLFNAMFKPLVDKLNNNIADARFTYINTSGILYPQGEVGMRTPPCCKLGGDWPCAPNSDPCAIRALSIFFDALHPAEVSNIAMAARAYKALLPTDTYPHDIKHLTTLSLNKTT